MNHTGETDPNALVECVSCGRQILMRDAIAFDSDQVCGNCKHSYAQAIREGNENLGADRSRAAEIRQEHLKHEASLKSVGFLYYLVVLVAIVGGVSVIITRSTVAPGLFEVAILGAVFIAGGLLAFFLGRGFRSLNNKVRIPGTIMSAIGLFGFPIGTLIHAYILYLVWSKKGKMVFSEEYQAIIRATPQIKYRTSPVSIVLLVFLITAAAGVLGYFWLAHP